MRHRVRGRKLGRTTAHRKAMFSNQLTALFTHERIITTVAKAKELRPLAERMVTLARTGSLPARRKVLTMVPDKEVVQRLFDDIAPRFMDRPGGYTRVLRLGRRRGDGAELAIIEFVDYELADHEEGGASSSKGKSSLMDRAKGMFGGGAKTGEAEAEQGEEQEMAAEEPEAVAPAEPETFKAEPAEEKPEPSEVMTEGEPEGSEAKTDDETDAAEPGSVPEETAVPEEQPEAPSEEPEAEEVVATDDPAKDEEKKDS